MINCRELGLTPDDRSEQTARENAAVMDRARQMAKQTGESIFVPAGWYWTTGFGPAVTGEPDFGTVTMHGEGRPSAFHLHPAERDHGILNLRNQGDWHDGAIRDLAFYGNGNGLPIVHLSGYSMLLQNLFLLARYGYGSSKHSAGILIDGGQHYTIQHVQADSIDGAGIQLDNVIHAHLTGCNGEGCDVGLLVTKSGGRSMGIVVDNFYAEQSQVAIRSERCTIQARNVFTNDRANTAFDLQGCRNCSIDASDSVGVVRLDRASQGNSVVIGSARTSVVDDGAANTIRTAAEPVSDCTHYSSPIWEVHTTDLHRANAVISTEKDEVAKITYAYGTDAAVALMAEVYDMRSGLSYDFATDTWGAAAVVCDLPYRTNQNCQTTLRVDSGDRKRRLQLRFWVRGNGANVVLNRLGKQ